MTDAELLTNLNSIVSDCNDEEQELQGKQTHHMANGPSAARKKSHKKELKALTSKKPQKSTKKQAKITEDITMLEQGQDQTSKPVDDAKTMPECDDKVHDLGGDQTHHGVNAAFTSRKRLPEEDLNAVTLGDPKRARVMESTEDRVESRIWDQTDIHLEIMVSMLASEDQTPEEWEIMMHHNDLTKDKEGDESGGKLAEQHKCASFPESGPGSEFGNGVEPFALHCVTMVNNFFADCEVTPWSSAPSMSTPPYKI